MSIPATTAHPTFVNLRIDFSINFFSISHLFANALSQRFPHVAAHEATKLMRSVKLFTSKSTYRYRVHIYKPGCPRQVNGKLDFSHATPLIAHRFLQSGAVLVEYFTSSLCARPEPAYKPRRESKARTCCRSRIVTSRISRSRAENGTLLARFRLGCP